MSLEVHEFSGAVPTMVMTLPGKASPASPGVSPSPVRTCVLMDMANIALCDIPLPLGGTTSTSQSFRISNLS